MYQPALIRCRRSLLIFRERFQGAGVFQFYLPIGTLLVLLTGFVSCIDVTTGFRKTLIDIPEQTSDRFPVSVIMQRTPVTGNRWIDHRWEAVGVTGGQHGHFDKTGALLMHEKGQVSQTLYPGLEVRLHVDQCESYYHNLLAPRPCCYVLVRPDEAGIPVPALVSASFDEAHAYLETDEEVFPVDLPPELYRWVEAFVVQHYVPQKRVKRRLDDGRTGGK